MTRIQKAIANLAAAASEFEAACDETYKATKHSNRDPQFSPEVKMYNLIDGHLSGLVYSRVQWRAIQGALAAWKPTKPAPVRSVPVTGRSGGAA
jgi:hypothetical protein